MSLDPELDAFLNYEHYQKYEALAQKLGVSKLITGVMHVLGLCQHADPVEYLRKHYGLDRHLNRIELKRWDSQEYKVQERIRKTGGGFHSPAQSVNLLKHVAIHHVLKEPAPAAAEDPRRAT